MKQLKISGKISGVYDSENPFTWYLVNNSSFLEVPHYSFVSPAYNQILSERTKIIATGNRYLYDYTLDNFFFDGKSLKGTVVDPPDNVEKFYLKTELKANGKIVNSPDNFGFASKWEEVIGTCYIQESSNGYLNPFFELEEGKIKFKAENNFEDINTLVSINVPVSKRLKIIWRSCEKNHCYPSSRFYSFTTRPNYVYLDEEATRKSWIRRANPILDRWWNDNPTNDIAFSYGSSPTKKWVNFMGNGVEIATWVNQYAVNIFGLTIAPSLYTGILDFNISSKYTYDKNTNKWVGEKGNSVSTTSQTANWGTVKLNYGISAQDVDKQNGATIFRATNVYTPHRYLWEDNTDFNIATEYFYKKKQNSIPLYNENSYYNSKGELNHFASQLELEWAQNAFFTIYGTIPLLPTEKESDIIADQQLKYNTNYKYQGISQIQDTVDFFAYDAPGLGNQEGLCGTYIKCRFPKALGLFPYGYIAIAKNNPRVVECHDGVNGFLVNKEFEITGHLLQNTWPQYGFSPYFVGSPLHNTDIYFSNAANECLENKWEPVESDYSECPAIAMMDISN